MEGGLFLLFVVIAMIARAIEAISKGEKGKQQPRVPPRRPRPEYEQPYGTTTRPQPRGERPGPRDDVPPDATEDAAAAMIPDELWEILTGRPKPQSRPRLPEPVYDEEADREEAEIAAAGDVVLYDEEADYERRRRLEEAQRQREQDALLARRRREADANTAANAPITVSLERPLPAAAARHLAFHEKVDAPASVIDSNYAIRRRRSPREWLFTGSDMKRAIVLQEVLGPPKGLEP